MLNNLAARLVVTITVGAALGLGTMATAEAAPASAASPPFGLCDGTSPANIGDGVTAKSASGQVTMQLRYTETYGCAWARLIGGHPGSQLWVDRTFDGGRTWQPWLGLTQVSSGTTDFTAMYDDAGVQERACGNWVHNGPTVCTAWF